MLSFSLFFLLKVCVTLHGTILSHLSTEKPYLCRLTILKIMERLDVRFSIVIDHKVVDLSQLLFVSSTIRLSEPGIHSFQVACIRYQRSNLERNPETISDLLQNGSSAVKLAILESARGGIGLKIDNAFILQIARHPKLSVTIRLAALEVLVNESGIEDHWKVEEILKDYRSSKRIPPMRDLFLILLGRGLVEEIRSNDESLDRENFQTVFFEEIGIASNEEQVSFISLSLA